ncbi:nitrate reductase molybdenum cofactor assembly chaperone [Brachybacterium saurashtrense]|uniref:Nitrate reductase molybdenum cofactor assembly chaperone n=1 Tax=Brachybacterium saurashtrense TaxID=556288 RepID=A0A345YN49_9MICO|nr:nitrate reductase molybdenum cofactor assembly chaperone [Brachybacterium saurashtrense]AXK45351.1 nitrate reductase molybdenum cofactor assembly chaperone [Brachybacterium saurashtrense]RRR21892.1 nitrate reductase molybdenum cofactor assembly chaperone [Brachybacterium saurashtrense]
MGALARLLGRRTGEDAVHGAAVAAARGPKSVRSPRDLLHASGLDTPQLRITWLAASWLLSYPDAAVRERYADLAELTAPLPAALRDAVAGSLEALRAMDPIALQEQYVDTFDTRRRGCLHLTYFSHGDTRRRGMALLRIKQDFRAAGLEAGEKELPDHLPLVLEFAAAHDPERGAKILRANRPGVELLRLHLEEIDSPWHGVLVALCATLPPLDADDRAAVLRLAEEGPEEETVGLDGYGLDADAAALGGQTFAASGCESRATAPGPVPVDLLRGRP